MKKIILFLAVLCIFSLSTNNISLGYEWICIDPGHGGPGASQYGSNGDGYGTYGPVYHLTEQWVNLQVALKCSTLLDESGQFYDIIMTCRTEQAEKLLARFLKMIKFDLKQ
jgi:N-acetylmuramoyl-L-alanine amidase